MSTWWGASDASAAKSVAQGHPRIGGWISDIEAPDKITVWWFQLEIKPEECPWAFLNGNSTRRISALEMLGTLILATFLILRSGSTMLRLKLSLISDNQGNIFHFAQSEHEEDAYRGLRHAACELALSYTKGAQLAPNQGKRDHNQWADDLTHPNPVGFTPEKPLSLLFFNFCLRFYLTGRLVCSDLSNRAQPFIITQPTHDPNGSPVGAAAQVRFDDTI